METIIQISGNSASIDFSNKDISGTFITSQNKQYHMLADTLYSEKSDNAPECVVVFTDTDVLYRKTLSGDTCVSDLSLCKVFNNGSCAFLTDDSNFIVLDSDGKQIAKRKTPEGIERIEYIGSYAWGVGFDDDDSTLLWLFNFTTKKSEKKKLPCFSIPDAECEVRELSPSDADIIRLGNHFIIGYDDGKTCTAYDFTFHPVKPSDAEYEAVFSVQRQRLAAEQAEKEKKRIAHEAYLKEKDHSK